MSIEHSPARQDGSRLLTPKQAGEYLGGLSTSTLAKKRLCGTGPRYCKLFGRCFYDIDDLDAFIDARRRTSTSQAA